MGDERLFEESQQIRELAEQIIKKRRELHWLIEADIVPVIGYVQAHEDKKPSRGKVPFADCRLVKGPFRAFCPYDVLITVYPMSEMLNENQYKVMLLHELKHIGQGEEDGIVINPHTTEDFYTILKEFGIDWNQYGEEVPDILKEEDAFAKEAEAKDELKEKRKQKAKGN